MRYVMKKIKIKDLNFPYHFETDKEKNKFKKIYRKYLGNEIEIKDIIPKLEKYNKLEMLKNLLISYNGNRKTTFVEELIKYPISSEILKTALYRAVENVDIDIIKVLLKTKPSIQTMENSKKMTFFSMGGPIDETIGLINREIRKAKKESLKERKKRSKLKTKLTVGFGIRS